ncbi:MAG: hypothetical protein R2726_18135 [Acidimicrobiales bacterium]
MCPATNWPAGALMGQPSDGAPWRWRLVQAAVPACSSTSRYPRLTYGFNSAWWVWALAWPISGS